VQPFSGSYHGLSPLKALILEDYDRAAPRGTGSAKVGGNYAPAFRFTDKARQEGFPVTLHLDSETRTEIEEFSTSGFVGVKVEDHTKLSQENGYSQGGKKVTLVLPNSRNIIASATSDSVVQIAQRLGWQVEIRAV